MYCFRPIIWKSTQLQGLGLNVMHRLCVFMMSVRASLQRLKLTLLCCPRMSFSLSPVCIENICLHLPPHVSSLWPHHSFLHSFVFPTLIRHFTFYFTFYFCLVLFLWLLIISPPSSPTSLRLSFCLLSKFPFPFPIYLGFFKTETESYFFFHSIHGIQTDTSCRVLSTILAYFLYSWSDLL